MTGCEAVVEAMHLIEGYSPVFRECNQIMRIMQ